MKYKYYLIDLDDTIFDFKKGEKNALFKTLKHYNISLTDDMLNYYSNLNEMLFNKVVKKEIDRKTFHSLRFENFFNYYIIKENPLEANQIYVNELSMDCTLKPYALEAVKYLSKIGKLYAASNGMSMVQKMRIKLANLEDYFTDIFISEDALFNKPDIRFFEYCFNKINDHDKSSYLMIGDREESDILGGQIAGIDTLLFDESNKVKKTVANYKINDLKMIKEIL